MFPEIGSKYNFGGFRRGQGAKPWARSQFPISLLISSPHAGVQNEFLLMLTATDSGLLQVIS